MEKVGLFWKKPYFFFKRLKLDNLEKSRAFSIKALLFPEKALLFRLKLRTQALINFHTISSAMGLSGPILVLTGVKKALGVDLYAAYRLLI